MYLEITQNENVIEQNVTSGTIEKLYNLAITSNVADANNNFPMSLRGNISVPAAYEDSVTYLRSKFPNLVINVPENKYYIRFKDPVISNFSINTYGDGIGITQSDAAASMNNNRFWGGSGMSSDVKSQVTYLDDFQYFTGITSTENIITGFSNAVSITFPSKTFYDGSIYYRVIVKNSKNIQYINYNNAQFVRGLGNNADSSVGAYCPIDGNDVIVDWDNSLVPNQTDLDHIELFQSWSKIQKIIYPEGITKIGGRSVGNSSLQYLEFPTTVINIGSAYSFGQSNGHRIGAMVVKATTPPVWYGWRPNESGLSGRGFGWDNFPVAIYVPDSAVNAYKSVVNNGTDSEQAWASSYIQDLIKPLSELPQIYRDMGTVTQEDIDRV